MLSTEEGNMNKMDPGEESEKNTLTSLFSTTVPILAYSSTGRNRMISDSQRKGHLFRSAWPK